MQSIISDLLPHRMIEDEMAQLNSSGAQSGAQPGPHPGAQQQPQAAPVQQPKAQGDSPLLFDKFGKKKEQQMSYKSKAKMPFFGKSRSPSKGM